MTKKLINVASTILDYSLDSEWCGSANIAQLIRGYILPLFVQRTSQGSHIFVPFIAQPTLKRTTIPFHKLGFQDFFLFFKFLKCLSLN